MRIPQLLSSLAGVAFLSCAAESSPEVGEEGQALLGGAQFSDCTDVETDELLTSVRLGRFAANSSPFRQCLMQTILGGANISVGGTSTGPYVFCTGDPNPGGTVADFFNTAMYVARSPNELQFVCGTVANGGLAETSQNDGPRHPYTEWLTFDSAILDGAINMARLPLCGSPGAPPAPACLPPGDPSFPHSGHAATIWHEIAHTHGYQHGNAVDPDPTTKNSLRQAECGVTRSGWKYFVNTMPYIFTNCMAGVLKESSNTCGPSFRSPTCAANQLFLERQLGATTGDCSCVDDPRLTRVSDPSGGMAVSGFGVFKIDAVSLDVYRFDGGMAWTRIGPPVAQIVANEDALYAIRPDFQAVLQFDGAGWTQIGGPASHLFAGGRSLFATNPTTGDVYNYEHSPFSWTWVGGPGGDFAVTRRGYMYGLSLDRRHVLNLWWDLLSHPQWTTIGGDASRLVTGGDQLYAVSADEANLMRHESGTTWTRVGLSPQFGELAANHRGAYVLTTTGDVRRTFRMGSDRSELLATDASAIYAGADQLYVELPGRGVYAVRSP